MSAFLYYMHDGPSTFRFELSGNLAGIEVTRLAQAWRTASSTLDGKTLAIDITFLKEFDEAGRRLLEQWWLGGAHLVANSPASKALFETITGEPYTSAGAIGPTFEPRYTASFRAVIAASLLAITLLFPTKASAAELKQETLSAWDQYLEQVKARMADRAKGTFLWADESPERVNRVRSGEVVVSPIGRGPQPVPSGLIHHWIGAAFISGARLDDVISIVRDYDRYTEIYKPSIIQAKTLSRKAAEDHFTVIMVDKAMFNSRALDSEYQSRFVEVGQRKWYSVSQTNQVHELAAQGQPVPDRDASGYIWRLSTITRYEERDGGVYIETEAMALSRPIPALLHLVVDLVVRRVSRASLTLSLEQTRGATESYVKSAAALGDSRRLAVSFRHPGAN